MPEDTPVAFEALLKELTQVVERLERNNLTLEESLVMYERGTELLRAAQAVLDKAQAKLEQLLKDADGSLRIEALDPSEFANELDH